jgi:hypothetical protein
MSDKQIIDLLNVDIKDYLKNILIFCGYDTMQLLSELNSECLDDIEKYIRNKMGNNAAYDSPVILDKYFGGTLVTFEEIQSFSFNPGARKTLLTYLPKAIKQFQTK